MAKKSGENRDSGGVQTVDTVLDILNAFIGAEPMPMLKSIAERADMHPAKVHRYLVSFCKSGYVRQDPVSGRYRLGPSTLLLGYAAMDAVPAIVAARPVLRQIVQTHSCSAFLAVWGGSGPRIVLQEKETAPVAVVAHVGSIFPLLPSATGRVFAAWMPRSVTAPLLEKELSELNRSPRQDCPGTMKEAEALFDDIRQRGLARATGQLSAAVHGLSAPVFDPAGNICAAVTLLGPAGQFNTSWSGPFAKALKDAVADIAVAMRQAAGAAEQPTRPGRPPRG